MLWTFTPLLCRRSISKRVTHFTRSFKNFSTNWRHQIITISIWRPVQWNSQMSTGHFYAVRGQKLQSFLVRKLVNCGSHHLWVTYSSFFSLSLTGCSDRPAVKFQLSMISTGRFDRMTILVPYGVLRRRSTIRNEQSRVPLFMCASSSIPKGLLEKIRDFIVRWRIIDVMRTLFRVTFIHHLHPSCMTHPLSSNSVTKITISVKEKLKNKDENSLHDIWADTFWSLIQT